MKKIVWIGIVFLLGIGVALANSDGGWTPNGGGNGVGGGDGGSGNWKPISPMSNLEWVGARFSLIYYDGKNYKQVGNPVDLWSNEPNVHNMYYGTSKTSSYLGLIKPYRGKFGTDTSGFSEKQLFYKKEGAFNVNNVVNLFSPIKNIKYLQSNLKKWFGISYDEIKEKALKGEHIGSVTCNEGYKKEGNSFNCFGYRVLLEPIYQFVIEDKNKPDSFLSTWYAMTLSEAGRYMKYEGKTDDTSGIGERLKQYSKMLYTTYKDIGIEAGTDNFNTNAILNLANPKVGIGLNIIDPTFNEYICSCEEVNKFLENDRSTTINNVNKFIKDNNPTNATFISKYKDIVDTKLFDNKTGCSYTYKQYANSCLRKNDGGDPPDGGSPEEKKYNCTPSINVGSCSTTNTSYYDFSISSKLTEKEYWDNCVFDNSKAEYDDNIKDHKTPKGTNSFYDDTLGNSNYCEVYCTESIVTNFERDAASVKAGSNFTWGNNSKIIGSRTCKTKSINWGIYTNETNIANAAMKKAYIEWQLKILQNKSIEEGSVTSVEHTTPPETCPAVTCKPGEVNCTPKSSYQDCNDCGGCNDYTVCTYTPKNKNVTFLEQNANVSGWSEELSGHNQVCPSPYTFVDTVGENNKKTAYENAQNNSKGLINKMKSCYTWNNDNLYNLNPTGSIYYSDGYSYSKSLKTSVVDQNTNVLDNNCIEVTAPNFTSCNSSGCNIENINKIKKCSNYGETKDVTIEYQLEDGVFQYILKSNNESIHKYDLGKEILNGILPNYIDVGYSNFPVAFKTENGYYGKLTGRGDLSIDYSLLGHNKNQNVSVHNILSSKNNNYTNEYGKWQCKYEVVSELIPQIEEPGDPSVPNSGGDISLIYRPIDLNNPFPSIDGKGRNSGSNWSYKLNGTEKDNSRVNTFIINNRGVKTDDVYKETPLYSFTLTPKTINVIKKYNKANNYANYEGKLDGKSYGFKCGVGTGKSCVSDYLTELIRIAGTENNDENASNGKCVNSMYRNYNDQVTFDLCNKKD